MEEVEVTGAHGLHARPAAAFAERAARFASSVTLAKDSREVDAKSVLLVLTLDVRQGDRVVVSATGVDAMDAVRELTEVLRAP